jgi:hypothetical protein
MEKLIELLNEYDSWWAYDDYYWLFQYWQDRDAYRLCKYQLVSKEYGFIKWLVDNDKIDHKIYGDMKFTAIKQWVLIDKKSGSTAQETREIIENGCIDTFIALLAIQDEPIEFLISILK